MRSTFQGAQECPLMWPLWARLLVGAAVSSRMDCSVKLSVLPSHVREYPVKQRTCMMDRSGLLRLLYEPKCITT
jgi:hypothetical protein